jgi:uncharacterized protein YndB with AHSA1/START domain
VDGNLRELEHGVELRFERDFRHPVDKVWAALTRPEKMREWLSDGEVDLRLGGRVYLKGDEIESTITELEPPHVIQYGWRGKDWDGGQIRWELAPTDDGTRLVFTHVFTPFSEAEADEFRTKHEVPEGWDPLPSTLAGWHSILAKLSSALDGHPQTAALDWRKDGEALRGWEELNEHYKKVLAR